MYLTIEIGKGFSHKNVIEAVKNALLSANFLAAELFPEAVEVEKMTPDAQSDESIEKTVENKAAQNAGEMSGNFLPPETEGHEPPETEGHEPQSMQIPREPGNILAVFKMNSERGDTSIIGRNTADDVREALRGLFKLSTKDNKALKDKKNEKAGRIVEFLVPGIQDLEDLTVVQAAFIMDWCKTESKAGKYLATEQAQQEAELIIKNIDAIAGGEPEKKLGPTPGPKKDGPKPGPVKKAGPKPASAKPKTIDGAFVCLVADGASWLFQETTPKELAETYPDCKVTPATQSDIDNMFSFVVGCFNALDSEGNPVCFTDKTTAADIEKNWPKTYTEITPATLDDVDRVG